MNCDNDLDSQQLQVKLQAITADIRSLANSHQGNSLVLLALLRALEHSHREIRENLFQASLPDSRQALYALLRDIEEEGGWPYIDRMKLQLLLSNLPDDSELNNGATDKEQKS
jgi:DNA-binding transcriptional regulator YbjK